MEEDRYPRRREMHTFRGWEDRGGSALDDDDEYVPWDEFDQPPPKYQQNQRQNQQRNPRIYEDHGDDQQYRQNPRYQQGQDPRGRDYDQPMNRERVLYGYNQHVQERPGNDRQQQASGDRGRNYSRQQDYSDDEFHRDDRQYRQGEEKRYQGNANYERTYERQDRRAPGHDHNDLDRRGRDFVSNGRQQENQQIDDRRAENYGQPRQNVNYSGGQRTYGEQQHREERGQQQREYGEQQQFRRDRQNSQGEYRHQGNPHIHQERMNQVNFQGASQQNQSQLNQSQQHRNFENQGGQDHGYNRNDRPEERPNYSGKPRLDRWAPVKENLDFLGKLERNRSDNIDTSMDTKLRLTFNSQVERLEPASGFAQFSDANSVETAYRTVGFKELRALQKEACPYIAAGFDVFLRSNCATGKTTTYLLPLIKRIIDEKKRAPRGADSPYVLIVAPSLELVKTIYETARVFAAGTSVSTAMIVGNIDYSKSNACATDVDMLTGTPQKLRDMLNRNLISLRSAITIVIEECDWYWHESLQSMLAIAQRTETNNRAQRILIASTFHNEFKLDTVFDKPRTITFESQEELPPVNHRFIRVNDRTIFQHLLHEIYKGKDGQMYRCVVVAANKATIDKTMRFLREQNVHAKEYATVSQNMQIGERERVLNEFNDNRFQVIVTGDNALLRGIRLPYVDKVIHLETPSRSGNVSIVPAFHHRIGCVAFNKESESVMLANLNDLNDIKALITACTSAVVNVPDWMHRVSSTQMWNDDDKTAADQSPVRQEEREQEVAVENFGQFSSNRRAYNYEYNKRFTYKQNRNNYPRYNKFQPNFVQNPQHFSQSAVQAFCSTPPFVSHVLTPITLGSDVSQQEYLPFDIGNSQELSQIQQMYAGGSVADLYAPNQQVIAAGTTSFYLPDVMKAPVLPPKLAPDEKIVSNNDGYHEVVKIVPVPVAAINETVSEQETIVDEKKEDAVEVAPLDPIDQEIERTPSPQEVDMEEVQPHPEPSEPRSSSVLTADTETDFDDSSRVVPATPSESLASSFERLVCDDATEEEHNSTTSTM